MSMHFPCLCCGYRTLEEEPGGTFEICPVCFWEDDNLQARDPTYAGGANKVSLQEARTNFARMGAKSTMSLPVVRPPEAEEAPPVQPWE